MRLAVFLKASKTSTKKPKLSGKSILSDDHKKTLAGVQSKYPSLYNTIGGLKELATDIGEAVQNAKEGHPHEAGLSVLKDLGLVNDKHFITTKGLNFIAWLSSEEAENEVTGGGPTTKKPAKEKTPAKPKATSVSSHFDAIYPTGDVIDKNKSHDKKDADFLALDKMGMTAWNPMDGAWDFTPKGLKAIHLWANKPKPGASMKDIYEGLATDYPYGHYDDPMAAVNADLGSIVAGEHVLVPPQYMAVLEGMDLISYGKDKKPKLTKTGALLQVWLAGNQPAKTEKKEPTAAELYKPVAHLFNYHHDDPEGAVILSDLMEAVYSGKGVTTVDPWDTNKLKQANLAVETKKGLKLTVQGEKVMAHAQEMVVEHKAKTKVKEEAAKKKHQGDIPFGPGKKAKESAENQFVQDSFEAWMHGDANEFLTMHTWDHMHAAGWVTDDGEVTDAGKEAFTWITGEIFPDLSQTPGKAQLVAKKIWVTKNGKTFQQTFWVNPKGEQPTNEFITGHQIAPAVKDAPITHENLVNAIANHLSLEFDNLSYTEGKAANFLTKYASAKGVPLNVDNTWGKALLQLGLVQHSGGHSDLFEVTELGKEVAPVLTKKSEDHAKEQQAKLEAEDKANTEKFLSTYEDKLDHVAAMLKYEIGDTEYIKPVDEDGEEMLSMLTKLGVIEYTGEGDQIKFDSEACQKLISAIEKKSGSASEGFKVLDDALRSDDIQKPLKEMADAEGITDFEFHDRKDWPKEFFVRVDKNNFSDDPTKLTLPKEAVGQIFTLDGHTFMLHAHYDWDKGMMDGRLRLTEMSTGLAVGPPKDDPTDLLADLIDRVKSGMVAPAVAKYIAKDGPATNLPDTEMKPVAWGADSFAAEEPQYTMTQWMKKLGLIEGEPEPEPEPEDDDEGGSKGSNWSGDEYDKPFEVNGVTWDGSVLKALDDWAGSPEYCKVVRAAMINAVDKLPVPARYQVKGHNGERTAKMFDAHVHALKEKKLWRATENEAWLEYKPGDFTPLGVASFTRVKDATNISSYSHVGGSVRIEVIPASKKGKLKGISIHDLVENGPDDWVDATDNIHRYKNEQEILLRCKALKIVSVDRAKRKVVAMAYAGKIPKTVVMKSKDVRPPVMHWDAMDDLSKPLSPRKKKAKGKKRGRK